MLDSTKVFSSFSTNDVAAAKQFYGEVLGLEVTEGPMGLDLKVGNSHIFIYPKDNHTPASFTVLNFEVDDIDKAVDELSGKGVTFEHYDSEMLATDKKGVARGRAKDMGPDIAWFKDPAGNILAVLQSD